MFVHAVWLSYFVNQNNLATATKTTTTVVEVFIFLFPGLNKNEVVQSYYIIILWMTNMDLVLCQFISDVQAQKQIVMIAMRTVFYRNLNRQPNLVCWQHYLFFGGGGECFDCMGKKAGRLKKIYIYCIPQKKQSHTGLEGGRYVSWYS